MTKEEALLSILESASYIRNNLFYCAALDLRELADKLEAMYRINREKAADCETAANLVKK